MSQRLLLSLAHSIPHFGVSRVFNPYLAQLFADYEPGIHLSQLQMQAGIVGINTSRVYSANKQLLDQDPQGEFCRKFVPELRDYPIADWLNPLHHIPNYPRPIVDDKTNIKLMKQRIVDIRHSDEAKLITQEVLLQHGSRKTQRKSTKSASKSQETAEQQLSLPL